MESDAHEQVFEPVIKDFLGMEKEEMIPTCGEFQNWKGRDT